MGLIYVASSWSNPLHSEVVDVLRAAFHEVYDYRNPPGRLGFSWDDEDSAPEFMTSGPHMAHILSMPHVRAAYESDRNAIRECQALVAIASLGVSSAWEVGYATGLRKPTCVLWGGTYRRELMLAEAAIVTNVGQVVEWAHEFARPRGPRSFGRFTYYGELWGFRHVWSTTDPPNYGSTMRSNGRRIVTQDGHSDPPVTGAEIAEAKSQLVEVTS